MYLENIINKTVYFIGGEDVSDETYLNLRNLIIGVLTTSILMWSYLFNTIFTLDDIFL